MRRNKIEAPCTVVLVAINIIVFLILSFGGMTEDGEYMLNHGALYVPYLLNNGEWYRMLTSIFLHFGFQHLVNNMLSLALLGWNLEAELGSVKYLIIYFGSGLCGNVLSAYWDVHTQHFTVSAGASGAIFGIIGALLYVAMRNKGRIGNVSGRGIIFMVLLTLYYGFSSGGVDNFAHIGGLLSGFVLGVLLYWKRKSKRRAFSGGGYGR